MKVGLVAGEASGDLLGAGLIEAIRARIPDAQFEGVAGPAMIRAGCDAWESSDVLAVMGIVEPLRHLPRLLRLRHMLARRWSESPPDVFVGIDAPDFNLGLEKRLRSAGIRTAHYVSPTVWAWRQGRVNTIRKAADLVLCILPFETRFYDEHDVPSIFVGHPKADAAPLHVDMAAARRQLGFGMDERVVAVLPGSRGSEIMRLGPAFAGAAARLAIDDPNIRFVTPAASARLRAAFEQQLAKAGIADAFTVIDGASDVAMMSADVVLLASGTAALEAAFLCRPMVAAYKLGAASAFIIRAFRLLKVDKVTMPNHLTDVPQVPEFIQDDATPDALAKAVGELLGDDGRRAAIAETFATLRSELALDSNLRAADAVIRLARDK